MRCDGAGARILVIFSRADAPIRLVRSRRWCLRRVRGWAWDCFQGGFKHHRWLSLFPQAYRGGDTRAAQRACAVVAIELSRRR